MSCVLSLLALMMLVHPAISAAPLASAQAVQSGLFCWSFGRPFSSVGSAAWAPSMSGGMEARVAATGALEAGEALEAGAAFGPLVRRPISMAPAPTSPTRTRIATTMSQTGGPDFRTGGGGGGVAGPGAGASGVPSLQTSVFSSSTATDHPPPAPSELRRYAAKAGSATGGG